MKRTACLIGAVVLALLFSVSLAEAPETGKLTLMVYMCGSNLESGWGSASADLSEMASAGIGAGLTVLVMTGGSESWKTGYDPEQMNIVELGSRGMRTVWTGEKQNMGEAETLTQLLAFAMENRPAKDYALILWNHGGGPMEGVCWDELFSMDRLSLSEITKALDAARKNPKLKWRKKLKWIGFDACLMGSAEVAQAMAPYADYMIASQETEPSFGWNYACLSGIEDDATGAETGRRIVDAYFDGHEDSADRMTLACLDLSKTAAVVNQMNVVFSAPARKLTADSFPLASRLRDDVPEFGRAVSGTDDNGHDLVDAVSLVRAVGEGSPAAEKLEQALNAMVVCSRSSGEDTCGVSLYHPFRNKLKYEEQWRETYEALDFSKGYTDYIRAFGKILLAEPLADWSGIRPVLAAPDENGHPVFSLQLTQDQREHLLSAQVLILAKEPESGAGQAEWIQVSAAEAELGETGLLTAAWAGQALYLESADGTLYGPVPFGIGGDGQVFFRMTALPENAAEAPLEVLYELSGLSGTDIVSIRVWDEATQSYTNRIPFDPSRYPLLAVPETGKNLPVPDGRNLLPDFAAWSAAETSPDRITVGNGWRVRWTEEQRPVESLYAVFRLTDVQQNVICSQPVPLAAPEPQPGAVGGSHTAEMVNPGNESFFFGLEAGLQDASEGGGLRLTITVNNPWGEDVGYRFSPLTLNGEKITSVSPEGWETDGSQPVETVQLDVPAADLAGLDRLETVDWTVTVTHGQFSMEVPVSARFEDFIF